MREFFIDKDIKSYTGEEAISMLRGKNDSAWIVPDIGVPKVDKKRWEEAQEYEYNTWCKIANGMTTDRNEDHEVHFGGYKSLNEILPSPLSIIELGCGPFTNLRLILPKLKKRIEEVFLLDPLVLKYSLEVSRCPYKTGMLGLHPIKMVSSPIEEFMPQKGFDLVVMINVVEHCYDSRIIFQKVYDMMSPGGIFLFGDHAESDLSLLDITYDAGHPIRVSREYFEELIAGRWEKIFSNEFKEEGKESLYWILKKI